MPDPIEFLDLANISSGDSFRVKPGSRGGFVEILPTASVKDLVQLMSLLKHTA